MAIYSYGLYSSGTYRAPRPMLPSSSAEPDCVAQAFTHVCMHPCANAGAGPRAMVLGRVLVLAPCAP